MKAEAKSCCGIRAARAMLDRPWLSGFPIFCLFAVCVAAPGLAVEPQIQPDELAAVKAAEAARIQAIESVYGTVVSIYGNDRQGGGSGVLYDPAGYVLTNHHVIVGAGDGGWAGLADGKLYRWKLIGTDPGGDVALIKLQGQETFSFASLGDSNKVRVGDWAMAMGNPFTLAEDQKPTVTLGIVSGVNRYQEGSGLNQLVYGNCIQVDSSINPGNSGGPLFNLRGEVIGINGRGSFEERGRVNVGLGYAISSNQIKNFLPELLAAKIAQHGTLDAVFGNRAEGVICYTMNLDAPIARAGLALGDRLIALEGRPIQNANELTNLLSTYPAGWPVEVTFEHEDVERTASVRLSPLPYVRVVRRMAPSEQPQEGSQPEQRPDGQKPGELPSNDPQRPRLPVERPGLPLEDAGKIMDTQLNRSVAAEILQRCQRATGEHIPGTLQVISDIRRDDAVVGEQTLLIGSDGRLRAEYTLDAKRSIVCCDGTMCWNHLPGREPQTIPRGKALLDPHFAQALIIAALHDRGPLAQWGELALDGADKADGRLCYRLSLTDAETTEQLFVWLTVFNTPSQPQVVLVKGGVGIDNDEPIPSTVYRDLRPRDAALIPQQRHLVRGLAEEAELTITTREVAFLPSVSTDSFQKPE